MLMIGFIFLLNAVDLLKAQKDIQQEDGLLLAKEGDNIVITCPYRGNMAMHFSWYKHNVGQKPELISTVYKYDNKATYYSKFKISGRFKMANGIGVTHLNISNLQLLDSATYYCGSAHSNIVEFGQGTELLVMASQVHGQSIFQKPVLASSHVGDPETLQCSVLRKSCAGEQHVYWFRHGLGESHPGIIYTHGERTNQCNIGPETDSPTQSCVYNLPKRNLSTPDAGTYYCAVAMCGEILFGNGTKVSLKGKLGEDCPKHISILVILSILRSIVLLCSMVITIWFITQGANLSDSLSFSGESNKKRYPTKQNDYKPHRTP